MAYVPSTRIGLEYARGMDLIAEPIQAIYYGILGRGTDEETDASAETGEACTVYVTLNGAPDIGIAYYDPLVINLYGLDYGLSVAVQKKQGKPTVIGSWMSEAPTTYGGMIPSAAWYAQGDSGAPLTINPLTTLIFDGTAPITVTGSGSTLTFALATPLEVQYGGTGLNTLTANAVILGNGTSDVTFVPPSTNRNVLISNGTTWQSRALVDADIPDALTISGGTITNSPISGSTGSFTTLSTSGAVTFNDAGADVDFRAEGDTDQNLIFLDASTDRVGIGTATPSTKFEVNGAATVAAFTSRHNANTELVTSSGTWSLTYAEANTTAATIRTQKARGTGYVSPGQVLASDNIMVLAAQSYGTSNYDTAALIRVVATQDQTNTARGSKVEIHTSATGTSGGALAATFGQDKSLTTAGFIDVGTNYYKVGAGSNAGNDRLWQDSSDKMLAWQTASGLKTLPGGVFWKMIAATSAITATSETSITGGTTWGTLTIPANTAIAGTYFEFEFAGLLTATAGNFRFVVKLNGTQIISFQSRSITTGGHFITRFTAKIVDTGGTANCVVVGNHMSAAGDNITNGGLGSPGNFAVGSSNTFTFFVFFDGSPSGQSVTVHTGIGKIY